MYVAEEKTIEYNLVALGIKAKYLQVKGMRSMALVIGFKWI